MSVRADLALFDERAHHIERALAYDDSHTLADVRALVAGRQADVWPGRDSIVITQVMEYPFGRVCVIYLAAGHMEEIERLHPVIEEFARALGCRRIRFAGRKGWERTFLTKDKGWKYTAAIYEKELT